MRDRGLSGNPPLYDILVVGAGVHGSSIACEAAERGLRTLLIQAGKLGGSASCLPANVLGLPQGDGLGMLLQGVAEQRELQKLASVAAHLVRPQNACLIGTARPYNRWQSAALGLMQALHFIPGNKDTRTNEDIGAIFPTIHPFPIPAFEISHTRIVIALIQQFTQLGGHAWFHNRVVGAKRHRNHWALTVEDLNGRGRQHARGKILINCTGCQTKTFLDQVLDVPSRGTSATRITGQVFVRCEQTLESVMVLPGFSGPTFIQAFDPAHLCLGPIIAQDESEIAKKRVIVSLIEQWNRFAKIKLSGDDIVHCRWASLPVLDDPSLQDSSYLDLNNPGGGAPLLNHFGINFVFYRRIARQALDILQAFTGARRRSSIPKPLPGAEFESQSPAQVLKTLLARFAFLPKTLVRRLLLTYGTNTLAILDSAHQLDDLGRCFGADLYEREVNYLQDKEWAESADDILWRRTLLGLVFDDEQTRTLEAYLRHRGALARA